LLLINVSIAGVTIATTYRKVPFDAKPALRAQRLNPVDIGGDAFGVLYILQKDGKIIRTNPHAGSMSVSTQFAALATGATKPTIGFSAIAMHTGFFVKDRLLSGPTANCHRSAAESGPHNHRAGSQGDGAV